MTAVPTFTCQESGVRLDKFLAAVLPDISRSSLQKAILAGEITLNSAVVTKPALRLETGDEVVVRIMEVPEAPLVAAAAELDVVFENDQVAVLNKAAGVVVHPGAGRNQETIANAALARWPQIREVGEANRPGIVHRLDKDTSGILVLAKTQEAYEWLVRQFKSRKTDKHYIALVDGRPPTPEGRIDAAVGRHPNSRQRMSVRLPGEGRKAVTEYATLANYHEHTLLDVKPITGRTHQIRVHLAFLGCPVVGDTTYGRKKSSLPIGRFFLHASSLKLTLPGEHEPREFIAPLPSDLNQTLHNLEKAG